MLIEHATDIRMRAEMRAGEMLSQMAERGERPKGRKKESHAVILSDLGVTPSQSSRWQKLASMPADEREEKISRRQKLSASRRCVGRFAPAPYNSRNEARSAI